VGRTNGETTRLTNTPDRHEEYPSWAESGAEILFSGFYDSAPARLFRISPEGNGDAEVSTTMHAPFVDTFSRDGRDASLWQQITAGTEVTLAQTGGRVEVTLGPGAVQGGEWNTIEGNYNSPCTLPGDFDLQVEYDALTWPAANGSDANLQAFGNAAVARESKVWGEQYAAWLSGPSGSATTEENAGALRLVRAAGRFRAFWRYEGVWVPIRSAPANTNPVNFGFTLVSFHDQFAHQQVKVAFDNFRLASGEVSCPSWWASIFGDLG
jgi:hypothetical protein